MKERHDMDRPAINTLGLCAGVGMLDLGVATALDWLGYRPRAAALCEWEAYAAACLLARMEDATLEPCPIWCGDLRDFDAVPFLGVVDVLAAGLPCQPYSVAGKQLGNVDHRSHGEDENGPIPQFLRIVEECRPSVVFCENVPPWIRDGHFRPVGEELCRLGYTIEDPLFLTAEAVGASHKRERVFVMAHNSLARSWEIPESDRRNNATDAHGCIDELANAQGIRRRGRSADERVASRRTESKGESGDMAHAASERRRALGTESTRFERGTVARDDGSNDMANAVWTQRPERQGRERVLDVCENAVGDAASERAEPLVTGSGSRSSIGESDEDMADASGTRLQGRRMSIATKSQHAESVMPGSNIFAPSPNTEWATVPEHLWPSIDGPLDRRELATAIGRFVRCALPSGNRRLRRKQARRIAEAFATKASAQPGFRCMVDGVPVVVDASRADQLRCGGNGCVPLVAAVAFVELFQRVEKRINSKRSRRT